MSKEGITVFFRLEISWTNPFDPINNAGTFLIPINKSQDLLVYQLQA